MAKNKIKLLKFPSFSRIITERLMFYLATFLSLTVIIVLIVLITIITADFAKKFINFQKTFYQRQEILGKINFWNSIAEKYSGFPDAYFNIAVFYYKLEDFSSSRRFLEKTLVLNPDYKNAKLLDKSLEKRGY